MKRQKQWNWKVQIAEVPVFVNSPQWMPRSEVYTLLHHEYPPLHLHRIKDKALFDSVGEIFCCYA